MDVKELKEHLEKCWSKETCSPGWADNWSKENPSAGQCAITALIVNDFFGGKIMRCLASNNSHYYNEIDGGVIDLTAEQFLDEVLNYAEGHERTREYLLGNENTKQRYNILKGRLDKLLENLQPEI